MDFLMENTSNYNFTNSIVRDAYNKIKIAYNSMQKNAFVIASSIAKLADNPQALKSEGYENVTAFGEQVLGLQKSQTYALMSVGKKFSERGKCVLGDSFSVGQLQAMLPIKKLDTIKEMVASGKITSDMSVRDIKAVVKKKVGKTVIDAKDNGKDKNVQISERSENSKEDTKVENSVNTEEINNENTEKIENIEEVETNENNEDFEEVSAYDFSHGIEIFRSESGEIKVEYRERGSADFKQVSTSVIRNILDLIDKGEFEF